MTIIQIPEKTMNPIYDDIGVNYSVNRCTDPKIALQLYSELKEAKRVINIGAGPGSYEPQDLDLIAVEPSSEMIIQRKKGSHPVQQAFAEKLPFEDDSFSHAMTVLSIHHWTDRAAAFKEINRVATEKFVAISWDPQAEPFWLTKDYFPEIHATDQSIFPSTEEFSRYFDDVRIVPLQIPFDCQDGFLAAFWKRPKAYLSSEVRQSISSFSKIKRVSEGLGKLTEDLSTGDWANKNQELLNASFLDAGYRLITARIRRT